MQSALNGTVEHKREVQKDQARLKPGTFGIFPAHLASGRHPYSQVILAWLWYYKNSVTNSAHPSIRMLMRECGIKDYRTVKTHLRELEEDGLIEVESRFHENGKRLSNCYVVFTNKIKYEQSRKRLDQGELGCPLHEMPGGEEHSLPPTSNVEYPSALNEGDYPALNEGRVPPNKCGDINKKNNKPEEIEPNKTIIKNNSKTPHSKSSISEPGSENTETPPKPPAVAAEDVERVFEVFRNLVKPRAKLTPDAKKKIASRLKVWKVEELFEAVARFSLNKWRMANNTKYPAQWFFHSDSRIEMFVDLEMDRRITTQDDLDRYDGIFDVPSHVCPSLKSADFQTMDGEITEDEFVQMFTNGTGRFFSEREKREVSVYPKDWPVGKNERHMSAAEIIRYHGSPAASLSKTTNS